VFQGKPLSYWVNELQDKDLLVREEALEVLAQLGPAAKEVLPLVTKLVKDEHFTVRYRAALALWKIDRQAKPAVALLLEALKQPSSGLRLQAVQTLAQFQFGAEAKEVAPALLEALRDPELAVRQQALLTLQQFGAAGVPALTKALDHTDVTLRNQAFTLLGQLG